MAAKVRDCSADLDGLLQAGAESSNCLSRNVSDKIKAKIGQEWKHVLSLLDIKYACELERILVSVVRKDNELLWNVTRCTALISTRLDKIDGALLVEGECDTANVVSGGPAETSGVASIDLDEPSEN